MCSCFWFPKQFLPAFIKIRLYYAGKSMPSPCWRGLQAPRKRATDLQPFACQAPNFGFGASHIGHLRIPLWHRAPMLDCSAYESVSPSHGCRRFQLRRNFGRRLHGRLQWSILVQHPHWCPPQQILPLLRRNYQRILHRQTARPRLQNLRRRQTIGNVILAWEIVFPILSQTHCGTSPQRRTRRVHTHHARHSRLRVYTREIPLAPGLSRRFISA